MDKMSISTENIPSAPPRSIYPNLNELKPTLEEIENPEVMEAIEITAELIKEPELLEKEREVTESENWRKSRPKMVDKNAHLLETGLLSDIRFTVGPEEVAFCCHKWILRVCSPVFDEIFTSWEGIETICLRDTDPKAFEYFLKFIYTEKLEIPMKEALGILSIAQKYNVPELVRLCTEFLEDKVTEQDAVLIYQAAKLLDDKDLGKKSEEYICRNFAKIVQRETFFDLTLENLTHFLEKDDLNIGELDLFESLARWGEVQCERKGLEKCPDNVKKVLGSSLNLIRFPTMNQKILSTNVVPTGLLECNQVVELFQYFTMLNATIPKKGSGKPMPIIPKTSFNTKKRNLISTELVSAFYSGRFINNCGVTLGDSCDWIIDKFTVNRSIMVRGFGFYAWNEENHKCSKIELSLTKGKFCEKVIYKGFEGIQVKDGCIRVFLDQPLKLVKNTSYRVIYRIKYNESEYLRPPIRTDPISDFMYAFGLEIPFRNKVVFKTPKERIQFNGKSLSGLFGIIQFSV